MGNLAVILLDTHVLVWMVADEDRLSRHAKSAIQRARLSDGLGIADVTIWELAFLIARGALRTHSTIENTVRNFVTRSGVIVKPITAEVAVLATQFPEDYPKDPIDRLIGATARAEGIALVTRDEKIRRSPLLKTIW
ncbi:MAG: type II toxin-antitoxin system VapC family toxin [Terriglobales bacterium]